MRALRLHRSAPIASAPLVLEDVPRPEPAPDELLVRVHVCAVCRTDLHVVEGDLPEATRPITPGHMVVGSLVEAGGGFARGDRVGVAWLRGTCGDCPHCAHGRENLCASARFTGVSRKSSMHYLPAGASSSSRGRRRARAGPGCARARRRRARFP